MNLEELLSENKTFRFSTCEDYKIDASLKYKIGDSLSRKKMIQYEWMWNKSKKKWEYECKYVHPLIKDQFPLFQEQIEKQMEQNFYDDHPKRLKVMEELFENLSLLETITTSDMKNIKVDTKAVPPNYYVHFSYLLNDLNLDICLCIDEEDHIFSLSFEDDVSWAHLRFSSSYIEREFPYIIELKDDFLYKNRARFLLNYYN